MLSCHVDGKARHNKVTLLLLVHSKLLMVGRTINYVGNMLH